MKRARTHLRYETIEPPVSAYADQTAFSFFSAVRLISTRWGLGRSSAGEEEKAEGPETLRGRAFADFSMRQTH